ncbi:hypothetical protein KFK09_015791 [Dendrobium nobile]|uniref:Uncharacterized protein n=1 Tax=Dendrobium nobile TaxID=94219 RepID=A0A8T3B701_DENNO|nr:hypothetical protein KFK09_015791 [Dendrobium nobile]
MRRFFGSFVAVRLRSFDNFPFLSDHKLRHFDKKKQRELVGSLALKVTFSLLRRRLDAPHVLRRTPRPDVRGLSLSSPNLRLD